MLEACAEAPYVLGISVDLKMSAIRIAKYLHPSCKIGFKKLSPARDA
jgi:hypothetical protein